MLLGKIRSLLHLLIRTFRGGQGQYTAKALDFFLESAESAGRRMNLPLLMILLTDGRASDDRLSLMMAGWKMQAAAWCNSFAIGLDPDADEEELFLIGGDLQHYALIDEVRLDSFIFIRKWMFLTNTVVV